ncbi:hypothetical protein [Melghirimyces profundicolus]|nr:hypothetical protein [Melghirimyces profundicolus]
MNFHLRGIVGAAAATGLLLGGTATSPSLTGQPTVQAAEERPDEAKAESPYHRFQKHLADYLGTDEAEVQKALESHAPKDVAWAAVIAKSAGRSLEEVLAAKTNKRWREVAESYGVPQETFRREAGKLFRRTAKVRHLKLHPERTIRGLAAYLGTEPGEVVRQGKAQGADLHDLVKAAVLSKAGGKPFKEVLALKEKYGSWKEVAENLGVEKPAWKKERKRLAEIIRREWEAEGKKVREKR